MQKLFLSVLALLLVGAGLVWYRTAPPSPRKQYERAAAMNAAALVDLSAYATAERMASLAVDPTERSYAEAALRIADHQLALAFTAALSDIQAHPPVLSPAALAIQARLQKSQGLLQTDQRRVTDLTSSLSQAQPTQKDALQDELDLAQSQLDLDNDEVAEADQDLLAAGGNPQMRIEALVQEHGAQVKARSGTDGILRPAAVSTPMPLLRHGALSRFSAWLRVRKKIRQISDARDESNERAAALAAQRGSLSAYLDDTKSGISELAQHSKSALSSSAPVTPASAPANPAPAIPVPSTAAPVRHSHEGATVLLGQTKSIAANQKVLTLLDRQAADQRQLAGIYQQWLGTVFLQSAALMHDLMLDAVLMLGVVLVLLFIDKWTQRLLNRPKLDRRQVETLRSIARIGLRTLAVIMIVLTLIGVPSELGAMIGIVGAGLTVALKDFIVAFFGWLMLMGRNGIRVGDWVEINGVSGEVAELGVLHTVLLETGNWSDAGHPTGRRVTFTNSFAIEGHYFNFSTSGQWLWDELQVIVPAGQDPYPVVDVITKQVSDATAGSARDAEAEWQRAVPSQRNKSFSGAPGVNVKPVVGGVEISVRYITRAHERFSLRTKLFQSAVDLLGHRDQAAPTTAPQTL